MMIISLTGFMGSGKSSVGKELQAQTGWEFIDLDLYVERKNCRSIPEIFESEGEAGFRKLELEALEDILSGVSPKEGKSGTPDMSGNCSILSLGGGTLMTKGCAELIREKTICIYLKASTDTLIENLQGSCSGRPMLDKAKEGAQLRKKIEDLMDGREHIYREAADITIDIDDFGALPVSIARQILISLGSRH